MYFVQKDKNFRDDLNKKTLVNSLNFYAEFKNTSEIKNFSKCKQNHLFSPKMDSQKFLQENFNNFFEKIFETGNLFNSHIKIIDQIFTKNNRLFVDKNKQTIIIDPFDIIEKNGTLIPEVLIFNISNYFEIISVSENILENSTFYDAIDPYNCIKEKIYIPSKKNLIIEGDLKKLVVIEKENSNFPKNNILKIDSWNNFDILHFLNSLHFQNLKDFRKTLKSYSNASNSLKSFRTIQKGLFQSRNLFKFKGFENTLNEINEQKISEYLKIKEDLKNGRQIQNMKIWIYRGIGILKSVLL